MSESLTRDVNGTTVPTSGKYEIDPAHSSARFQVRHMGLSKVRGGFDSFSGAIIIDEDPTKSSVDVSLDAASFSTGNEDRDNHIKSPDFLDVENHPALTFRSTSVAQDGDAWNVEGELTAVGVTRPVTLHVEFDDAANDPWGNNRVGFEGTTEINRDDLGVNWNQPLETGGLLIGKTLKISIDVEAVAAG